MVQCKDCKYYVLHQQNGQEFHVCRLFNVQTNGSVDECEGKITDG